MRRAPVARAAALVLASAVVVGACSPAVPSSSGAAVMPASSPPSSAVPAPASGAPPASASASVAPAPASAVPVLPDLAALPASNARFPPGYTAYHTYAGMVTDITAVARAHPDLVRLVPIGRSAQGRVIWAARVGADIGVDHGYPEILFDGLHHGMEHLGLEMTLAILHWLADGYGIDRAITRLLDSRVVDIVFAVNPDGAEYDVAGGHFHEWRKNRGATPGSAAIGTDLNRNYPDHWGCCGLVSSNPASPYFRGPAPLSAPETRALAGFVASRVVGGRQRITVAVTFHSSGRLVLWPYGYMRSEPPGMPADDRAVFVALGRAMAARNGYRPEQASGLYVDSGTSRDWLYGRYGIFAFTIELGTGTYQPSSAIGPETARNRSAILYLMGMADCPYRAIGRAAAHCAGSASG